MRVSFDTWWRVLLTSGDVFGSFGGGTEMERGDLLSQSGKMVGRYAHLEVNDRFEVQFAGRKLR
jgi:hypothetical protein